MQKMAFKYRVYPTTKQRKYLELCFHWCRWFYGFVLRNRSEEYKLAKKNARELILSNLDFSNSNHPHWFAVNNMIVKKIPDECYPFGKQMRINGSKKHNIPSYYNKLLIPVRTTPPCLFFSRYSLPKRFSYPVFENFSNVPAVVAQEVIVRVDSAFNKFFNEGAGYPKYPKERNYRSATWTNGNNLSCKLYETPRMVFLSGFPGLLKIDYHRPIEGTIKRANVSKDILGQYYISFTCEFDKKPTPAQAGVVGIDMNIKAIDEKTRSFITCSNGTKIDIPRWYSLFEKGADGKFKDGKLKKLQIKISKCEIGSLEWKKYNRILKHNYEKIGNKKDYWLHNLTTQLERENEYVVIEALDLPQFHKKRDDPSTATNMELAGERGQRKAWTEAPFGEFKRQLAYKLGDRLIKVNPAYTSMMCNSCSHLNDGLTLDQREWDCPNCGAHHDRDVNAAINIRNAGLAIINNRIKTQQESKVAKA